MGKYSFSDIQDARREERRKVKPKKVRLVPIPKLMKKAQEVFNQWVRMRDQGLQCISCNKPGNQAGHYFPVRYSGVRFHPDNVNLQDAYCNCYAHGNPIMYRIGLIRKIGEERVQQLERLALETKDYKWTRETLNEIISTYKEKQSQLRAA